VWVGEGDLTSDPRPAVLVGLWLNENAEAATVLKRRSGAGRDDNPGYLDSKLAMLLRFWARRRR